MPSPVDVPADALVVDTLPFQGDFLTAPEQVVLLDGPWRSGKTHVLILDALAACDAFANNLLWFGRHESTKLRDSTLRDFHRLIPPTSVNWREQAQEYRHPSNGSVIMFRHLEDKTGLVNMDLGGVYIEQAEECDPEAFDFLLGRLSRVASRRTMRLTCNPNGHDWLWQYFYKVSPDYRGYRVITCPPATENPHVPASYVESLRASLSPEMFEQYVLGSREVMFGYRFFDQAALRQQAVAEPIAVGFFVDDYPRPDWRDQAGGPVRIYERYNERDAYNVALDVATGEGSSRCAGIVRNCTLNRVAAVIDADLRPDEHAVQGWLCSRYYGQAVIAPERNGIGFSVLQALRLFSGNIFSEQATIDPGALARTALDGWLTDGKSRMELFAQLQREIAQRNLELKDKELIEQMKAITMSKRGRPEAERGFRDDLVLALGIGGMVRRLRPPLSHSASLIRPEVGAALAAQDAADRKPLYGNFGRAGVRTLGR